MAKSPKETPRPEKVFPVSWDQFHRDSRALAWRLHESGPFEAIVCITRGGLVPAAISTGIGSQVQQPLACVIVGGMLLSPICSLLVIPTFARLFMPGPRKAEPAEPVTSAEATAEPA